MEGASFHYFWIGQNGIERNRALKDKFNKI